MNLASRASIRSAHVQCPLHRFTFRCWRSLMPDYSIGPLENHLLAALTEAERSRLLPHLEQVEMPIGKVLHDSGTRLSHVYFPTTSIVSMLCLMEDGASAEIAVI